MRNVFPAAAPLALSFPGPPARRAAPPPAPPPPRRRQGDCWLIEGDKGYVQNQPPYETIPQHINNTVHDLRLNENKLKAVLFTSMYRFTNLTDLNLTKNEISYVEDGAFAGQANLQVLQLGYNKLTNLTEGMMRGLGRMQCLFLQHNLVEVIASNAFWECPSLSSIDLSSNKLARIDPSTFTVLSRLMVCELAANPFHCGCDLYSFLSWMESFNNVTHTYDRLQCETPREMFGYPLLSPIAAGHAGRNAKNILSSICRDGVYIPGMTSLPPDLDGTSGMGLEIFGGMGPYHQPTTSSGEHSFTPSIKLNHVSLSAASILVQIPRPFSKMYILTQYNHTFVSDVMNLKNKKELITLDKLKSHTNYTFCVASIRNSQRYNHTCLQFATRAQNQDNMQPTPSTTSHYIMTIVGCLFGMLIVLGFVYYCLRKKRMHNEKQKSICVKKTILEMRYGPEVAAAVANDPSAVHKLQEQSREHHQYQHHHGGKLPMSASSSSGMLHSANTSTSRLSSIPQVEKMSTAFSEAMLTSKGNYMDVRTGAAVMDRVGDGHSRLRDEDDTTDIGEDSDGDGRGSASEISTIAMEVDKVNQIINNCIDALKLDAAAVAAVGASANHTASSNPTSPPPTSSSSLTRGMIPLSQGITETCQVNPSSKTPPPPPLPAFSVPLSERPGISGGGFVVTPPYRPPPPATAVRPIQRQMSADAAVVMVNAVKKQCSTTSCGSMGRDRDRGGSRVYSLDVSEPRSPDTCSQQQSQYPERASPVGCGEPQERLPLLEVQQDYHCSEHRHSVPALYYEGSHQGSPAQRASFLKPLTRARRDAASYSQLSPARHHSSYSGYSSSPEYSSESSLRIWERFRPYRKGHRDESCYVTAGNALRKKVQFAKGEDLHDILDYWKGVLQLGYNKLTNLTEGMMRGLGRMQCLFLQHNLVEVIASNAFWECPSLSSIDLSSNKLARIDPSTFTVLSRLMVCELAANPFHCGCDLYSFLSWMESFNNVTHTYDRLQCETPREMFGYPLLSPIAAGHAGRNAKNILSSICRDGVYIPGMTSLPPDLDGTSGMGLEIFGGMGPYHQPTTSSGEHSFTPSIKLNHVSLSAASILVQIPRPFSKMYILTQYNHTFVSDVMNLKNKKELITLDKLKSHTNYTFCVASIRNSQRYNHTCLQFATRAQNQDNMQPTPSTTSHYIMTIVGCLFGMLIVWASSTTASARNGCTMKNRSLYV
ncbi:hypothetical protein CRUP_005708 [Coryphaenoides rupestris]|nr:hypothetical protein CRUP_005708 [Coryphaenoides rupestris]